MAVLSPGHHIVILAGPNGAGKSTVAPRLLRGALRVSHFVNADVIARGLSGFDPDSAALAAGRIMFARIDDLAKLRENFEFETTLARRSLASWSRQRIDDGFRVTLVFLSLPSPEMAVERVRERVRRGGHDIPEETIRRRFARGVHNLFDLYLAVVTDWRAYDSSEPSGPRLVALGKRTNVRVLDTLKWCELKELAHG